MLNEKCDKVVKEYLEIKKEFKELKKLIGTCKTQKELREKITNL